MMAPNPIKYIIDALEYALTMQDAIREGHYVNVANPEFDGSHLMISECVDNLSLAHWALHTFTPLAIGRTEENLPDDTSVILFEDAPEEPTLIFLPREYSESASVWRPWVPRTVTEWRLIMQQGIHHYELRFDFGLEFLPEDFYQHVADCESYKEFMEMFTVELFLGMVR